MRCPLCNSQRADHWVRLAEFLVCSGCSELLRPAELVRWATHRTRRRYQEANR